MLPRSSACSYHISACVRSCFLQTFLPTSQYEIRLSSSVALCRGVDCACVGGAFLSCQGLYSTLWILCSCKGLSADSIFRTRQTPSRTRIIRSTVLSKPLRILSVPVSSFWQNIKAYMPYSQMANFTTRGQLSQSSSNLRGRRWLSWVRILPCHNVQYTPMYVICTAFIRVSWPTRHILTIYRCSASKTH